MYLRSIEVRDFRSLEHVKLDRLGQFNVLIGRNNSGKSAIFGALAFLNGSIHSSLTGSERALPAQDARGALHLVHSQTSWWGMR